jgi:hypothetical protein
VAKSRTAGTFGFSSNEAREAHKQEERNRKAQAKRDAKAAAGELDPEFSDHGRERRVSIAVTRGERKLGRFSGPASMQIPSARLCAKFHSQDIPHAKVLIYDHDGVLDETWIDGRKMEEAFLR